MAQRQKSSSGVCVPNIIILSHKWKNAILHGHTRNALLEHTASLLGVVSSYYYIGRSYRASIVVYEGMVMENKDTEVVRLDSYPFGS